MKKIGFFVLLRILTEKPRLTVTDEDGIIVCHSEPPYPVWVYTREDSEAEYEKAYEILKEHFGNFQEIHFNCKYEFAEYAISRAKSDGYDIGIVKNLKSYLCRKLKAPTKPCNYGIRKAGASDADLCLDILRSFRYETKMDQRDGGGYLGQVNKFISSNSFFLLFDRLGEYAASCTYTVCDGIASVGNVYTAKDKRRLGYASAVVYEATREITEMGLTPILYTDADYSPSNLAYMKLGYVQIGTLCTVGASKP